MSIEITEEMRRAVYAADCARLGHMFDTSAAIGATDEIHPEHPRGLPSIVLRAPDPEQLPHLLCRRCGQVWIVIDTPGAGYDDALACARARMAEPDAFAPRLPWGVHNAQQRQQALEQQMHGHGHGHFAAPAPTDP